MGKVNQVIEPNLVRVR